MHAPRDYRNRAPQQDAAGTHEGSMAAAAAKVLERSIISIISISDGMRALSTGPALKPSTSGKT